MSTGPDIAATRRFGETVDFGRTAQDYRAHRAGFPSPFFERIARQLDLRPGQAALDMGTGTGTVARGLARLGLAVTGIDPAAALLREAMEIDQTEGVAVAYREGRAEALDAPDCSFDLVSAGQCWHWFDRARAAHEAFRVLKPGGAIVIAHFDWLPLPGNVVEATETLILSVNPAWTMGGGSGLYPAWLADLAQAGFEGIETASFDVDQPYGHDAWCGRIRASAGVRASLDEAATERFAIELKALLQRTFPEDPLLVPHRVWWALARRPQS
ncbi:methyltransferase domain-containing protein [Salinarimonas soli]|uniref:Methyltransferase domain-containing protein n=2 Tax=Salinarimonas soli TaxID=1638099 RepID=A0A5B2VCM1_9HYPH|nr:methyltransferase domain-containing protein [Salinarimonas soli]